MRLNTRQKYTWLFGLLMAMIVASCTEKQSLFQQLEAGETGVTFTNQVTEDENLNIINYTNIYNGGGVAVADFNNDGLQDLYFTGSMVNNELYLNQGTFEFKNVTEKANVTAADSWSSGVAAVDINSDGLMDLYVCATTYEEPQRRSNLLYINQGTNDQNIPAFKEMASEYNLADTTNTTMAAFFDYDNDGDLDLYLLVNKFTRNNSLDRYHEKMLKGESVTTDRLYRNEGADSLGHPWFADVSKEAGILIEGFGLGVNVSDINKDGWKDVYVSNDFITNEVVYINNGDGTFTDKAGEMFKHTVHSGMGNDVVDVNNDGHADVVMVDMLPADNYRKKKMLQPINYMAYVNNERYKYDYQYVRNQLHLYLGDHPETGVPLFGDIGMYSGISATDWSWTPLVADFDNDGWRDMIITNGFPKDITDHDFGDYITEYYHYLSMDKLLSRIPSVKLSNYAFRNNGSLSGNGHRLTFENVTERWGMKTPSFSNGAAQVDLDNDGDLDYVVNNINDSAFVFRNHQAELNPENNNYLRLRFKGRTGNTMGLGALVEIEYGDGEKQFYEHTTYRGYLSSMEPIAHFGLGNNSKVNKLTVTWPDSGVQVMRDMSANQVLTLDIGDAEPGETSKREPANVNRLFSHDISGELGIDYVHQERDFNDFNIQPLLPHKLSQYGPGLSVGDANGDGLDDMYISGAFEYRGTFFVQQPDGTFSGKDLLKGDNSGNREEALGSLFFDADGDGDEDLYIVSGGYEHEYGDKAYQDRLFINQDGRFELEENALPGYFLASGSAVKAADFDKDGDLDLFVGGRVKPHAYPQPVDSYILRNSMEHGQLRFEIVNKEVAPSLNEIGMVSDALWTDFNNDGWMDLVLAGEWMPLRFLQNDSGRFRDITASSGIAGHKGWWNSLCGADFDSDGDTDYIAGNLGVNTPNEASQQYPIRIYGNDFDKNGTYDAIPAVYYESRDGKRVEVPFHGREDLRKQLPSIFEKFKNYHAFATATMDEILLKFDTAGTQIYSADYMKSSFIENEADETFKIRPLPDKAQWAPVNSCMAEDITNDGHPDVVMVTNDYGTEVLTGRYDALNGLVLNGDGDGNFSPLDFEKNGFFVPGDGKALVKLRGADGSWLVAASQNRGPLKVFRNKQEVSFYEAKPMDASAILNYENGTSRKVEFYYGSSFLSSSGRFIPIDGKVSSLLVEDYRGNKRTLTFE